METRIPHEAGPSQVPASYFDMSPRRSINPVCRDVQAALSSFRFSGHAGSMSESPSSGAPALAASLSLPGASDDEYVEPLCMADTGSRRPSVLRTSSAPEPSSTKAALFVETSSPSTSRPNLARACSESRASGVLERRRHKLSGATEHLPSNLILDLADLPMTMGAGNLGLLRAARKAIAEPSGFDWGRVASSAPPSTSTSRFAAQQQQAFLNHSTPPRTKQLPKLSMPISLPASTSASTSTSPEAPRTAGGLSSSRSCVGSYWSNRTASDESEWDWALAGNARASYEASRCSAYKETKEPVHDIWYQLPDWMSRRSSHGGRDADLSLRGPSLTFGSYKPFQEPAAVPKTTAICPAALSLAMANTSISQSPRNSISGRGRMVHVPFRVIEEVGPDEGSISPRASVVGPRDHASDHRPCRSVEGSEPLVA